MEEKEIELSWKDLVVDCGHISDEVLTKSWEWLIGKDVRICLISSLGDFFFTNDSKKVFWLEVGGAIVEQVADNEEEFKALLTEQETVEDWFLVNLVLDLKLAGQHLNKDTVYSFKQLPIFGGEYEPDNFKVRDIEAHFSVHGQMHEQTRDLPDGVTVQVKKKE